MVAEGVWWLNHCPGPRSVNALTSQRLTDQGGGSTFYDNTVDVRSGREIRLELTEKNVGTTCLPAGEMPTLHLIDQNL